MNKYFMAEINYAKFKAWINMNEIIMDKIKMVKNFMEKLNMVN
jgi:hypothetical protein